MQAAIGAVPYASSVKVGLQFKRRFWEEDEQIYGGISYTDLPITPDLLSQHRLQSDGQGRAARRLYLGGPNAYEFTSMSPRGAGQARRRIRLADPSAIQARVRERHRGRLAPRPLDAGLRGDLDRERAGEHYDNLCQIDGRIVLAGEHASYMPAWQEGAILSALDAITRLHERVVQA